MTLTEAPQKPLEEAPQKPLEKVSPLKMSEALRLAEINGVRQTTGKPRTHFITGYYAYCALGAIALVTGYNKQSYAGTLITDYIKQHYSLRGENVFSQIIRWNDTDHLSFGQIADRLEAKGY